MGKFIEVDLYFEGKKTKLIKGDRVRYNKSKNAFTLHFFRRNSEDEWVPLMVRNNEESLVIEGLDQEKPAKYVILIYTHRDAKRLHKMESKEDRAIQNNIRWYKLRTKTN